MPAKAKTRALRRANIKNAKKAFANSKRITKFATYSPYKQKPIGNTLLI